MTMIKPKLTLFKMKIKVWFMNASKLVRPGIGDAPEVLDAVDVIRSVRKFVFCHDGCDNASCSQNSRNRHRS